MLHRLGWRWEECSKMILRAGLVVIKDTETGSQLVTGGSPMTEGRHMIHAGVGTLLINVGAVRPGLDHDKERPGHHQR
jgi:hypothetical protein